MIKYFTLIQTILIVLFRNTARPCFLYFFTQKIRIFIRKDKKLLNRTNNFTNRAATT